MDSIAAHSVKQASPEIIKLLANRSKSSEHIRSKCGLTASRRRLKIIFMPRPCVFDVYECFFLLIRRV